MCVMGKVTRAALTWFDLTMNLARSTGLRGRRLGTLNMRMPVPLDPDARQALDRCGYVVETAQPVGKEEWSPIVGPGHPTTSLLAQMATIPMRPGDVSTEAIRHDTPTGIANRRNSHKLLAP
jgi:hypothetical protein